MAFDVPTLIARIRAKVNVASMTVLPDADVLEAINGTQERMAQSSSEWRNLELRYEFTSGPTDDGVPLPGGLRRLEAVSQVDTTQTAPADRLVPLGQTTRGAWIDRTNAVNASDTYPVPAVSGSYFYVWAGKLYLVPQLSASQAFVLDYLGIPDDLTLTGPGASNFFTTRYFRTLKWGALSEVWAFLHQDERAALALLQFERHLERGKANETGAKASGPKRTRGV